MRLIVENDKEKDFNELKQTLKTLSDDHNITYKTALESNAMEVLNSISVYNRETIESIFRPFAYIEIADSDSAEVMNKLKDSGIDSFIEDNIELKVDDALLDTTTEGNEERTEELFDLINYNDTEINIEEFNESVIISVVDSGVDYENKFLKESLWKNPLKQESYGFNFDKIGEEAFFDVYDDLYDHGTFINGVIGSYPEQQGVRGVLKKPRILNLKFLPSQNNKFTQVCLALIFSASLGASVVNCSWSLPSIDNHPKAKKIITEILKFLRKKRCIPVFAAMNDGKDIVNLFPQNSKDVITVGSLNKTGQKPAWSNWGKEVDIWAPGENIWSYEIENESPIKRAATSFTAPLVTSAIALLKAYKQDLSIKDVKKILENSSCKKMIEIDGSLHKIDFLNIDGALNYLKNNY